MKARALTRRGDLHAAAAQYQAILEAYPQNKPARQALAELAPGLAATEPPARQRLPDRAQVERMLRLLHTGQLQQALALAEVAAREFPDQPLFHNIVGTAQSGLGNSEAAISSLQHAVAMQPDYAEAYQNLGGVYSSLGRHREASEAFRGALRHGAPPAETSGNLLYEMAKTCDWATMSELRQALPGHIVPGLGTNPFKMLALEDSAARHRQRAQAHAQSMFRTGNYADAPHTGERIRIGYFSPDFRRHAVSYLLARVLELHDREQFEIHAFSLVDVDDTDPMRERVRQAVDVFHDVAALADDAVVELARSLDLDIAVDLGGYTKGARPAIFAARTAPIQINYLGYPGTLGAPFMDYLLADPVVIPANQREHYSEQIIYLPHSYQANDDTRTIGSQETTRQDEGLPATGFVFCCFNNSYKIGPAEFDIWMRLLRAVPGSVLWLMQTSEEACDALKRQATARGVNPARLVFARSRPLPQHLARQRLADLFLDTFIYNAHTTASDALWAGLPVLTLPGQAFAARVAASLVQAAGMPELICRSTQEYEARALELAHEPAVLQALRDKLNEQRRSAPLFNSALTTAHIESAYRQAIARQRAGALPADMWIEQAQSETN